MLSKTYSSGKTLETGKSIRYIHDIIQGMIHLHSLDILHLDLKASNIFIGDDNKLIIADFGQSKMINDDTLVKLDNIYPSIMTPEGIRKKVGDKTTDIYQFGVLLYSIFNYDIYRNEIDSNYQVNTELLNRLFNNNSEEINETEISDFKSNMKRLSTDIRAGNFPNRNRHHHYIPKIIQDIINKCLEPAVEDRYLNFYEIQTELSKLNTTNKVQDLVQNLDTKRIEFSKLGIKCYLDITEDNNRFGLRAFKNERAKNALNADNLTRVY
ncbi:MAG: protein kinase [Saprospiraceae bacterium]